MWLTPLLQGAAQQQAGGTGLYLRNVSSAAFTASVDPGKPTGTEPTDLLIAVYTGSIGVSQSVSVPPGWTAIPGATVLTTGQTRAWWALGSVAGTTFTDGTNGGALPSVTIFAFAGADTTNPIRDAAAAEEYDTTCTAPSVSANAGDSLVHVWYDWQSFANFGPASPGGVVDRVNINNARTINATVENLASTGATSAQTRSATNFTGKRSATIAIAAAPTGPTIYRPTSDITTTGWTASSGGVLFDMIDEVIASDTDYIASPELNGTPGPATFGISSASAGTYIVQVRAKRTSSTGQLRIVMKDAGGTSVGASAWQSVTADFDTYTLPVTTTGTATQFSIEVAP